jgi:hypothetical protein
VIVLDHVFVVATKSCLFVIPFDSKSSADYKVVRITLIPVKLVLLKNKKDCFYVVFEDGIVMESFLVQGSVASLPTT